MKQDYWGEGSDRRCHMTLSLIFLFVLDFRIPRKSGSNCVYFYKIDREKDKEQSRLVLMPKNIERSLSCNKLFPFFHFYFPNWL